MLVYKIYAEEIKGLTGIVVLQYNPYHAGHGAIYWVKDRDGVEIPVVTPHYSLWGKMAGEGFGRPDQIADRINAAAEKRRVVGLDDRTRLVPICQGWGRQHRRRQDEDRAAVRGVAAVEWCMERLAPSVHVVSLEEVLWRIRMKHDPDATRKIIDNL